eukprot:g6574.t1
MTIFRWPGALNSKQVSVTGTFSDWNPVELQQESDGGDFYSSFRIPIGAHEYKFLADKEWKIFPSDPVTVTTQGNCNNHMFAYPTVRFVWEASFGSDSVYISGSFNHWKQLLPLDLDPATGNFTLDCYITPGRYDYLFLVDGEWRLISTEPYEVDANGRLCNQIFIEPYLAYRIYYATGWEEATIKARLHSLSSGEKTDWTELSLCDTSSRAQFFGVNWKVAIVVRDTLADFDSPNWHDAILEFYAVSKDGNEDHPRNHPYYICPVVGGYKLQNGVLKPFSKAVEGPVMLVSDIDGTMVNDEGPDPDSAMKEFAYYWENNASLCNSLLVYNTGRSMGQFTYLLNQKAGFLSLPDAVITAVGTKIFHLSTGGRGRSRATGLNWIEDITWSSMLDKHWNLGLVREAGDALVYNFGGDRISWLDYGNEHPHRVAFSVKVDHIEEAKNILKQSLAKHELDVQLIISGTGGWRYLDCVPINGGKLEALEYIRKFYNVPVHRCVAAGDSCNDISMLEGENPAIVVGNAQEDLRNWLLAQPQTSRVVFADANHARGILEGLGRLGLY